MLLTIGIDAHTDPQQEGCRVSREVVSSPASWYCIQTFPNIEARAFSDLTELGFRAHFPRFIVRRRRYNRDEEIKAALLPTYLFVALDLANDQWGPILRLPGVRRFLAATNGTPTPLRPGEVERLQGLGRAGDGIIDEQSVPFPIGQGDAVRFVDGPMTDWTGVCAWSADQRVGVLMTMFGGPRVVAVSRSSVELA